MKMKKISIIVEVIMIIVMVGITVVFAIDTIHDAPSVKECQMVASSIEKVEENNGPETWVIESISNDYAEVEVQHADGYTYTHQVYKCYNQDNYLVIVLEYKGELHKFAYFE